MAMNSTLGVMHTVLPATLRVAKRPDCACFLMVQFAGDPWRENDGDAWVRQQPSGVQQTSLFKSAVSQMAIECSSKIVALEDLCTGKAASDELATPTSMQDEASCLMGVASGESNNESVIQAIESPESSGPKTEALSSVEPAADDALDANDGNESDSDDDDEEEECCNESDQEEDAMPCAMG